MTGTLIAASPSIVRFAAEDLLGRYVSLLPDFEATITTPMTREKKKSGEVRALPSEMPISS
ncbi:MAG: hypothetical protein QM638_11875 [Nocardioides sp.]